MQIRFTWAGLGWLLAAGLCWGAPEPPPLTLQAPHDTDAALNGANATLRGQTAPGARVTLTVGTHQWQTTAGPDGAFTLPNVPLAAGANDVRLTAVDAAGNMTTIGRQVTRPAAAPMMNMMPPAGAPAAPPAPPPLPPLPPAESVAPPAATPVLLSPPYDRDAVRASSAGLLLSGQAAPGSHLTLLVQGQPVATTTADGAGRFNLSWAAVDGPWTVTVMADPGGQVTRRVELSGLGPDVQMYAPGPLEYVETPSMTLRGRSVLGAQLELSGGKAPIQTQTDERGFFVLADVPVADGINNYILVARDDTGAVRRWPVSVHGRVSNPWLAITTPSDGWQRTHQVDCQIEHEDGVLLSATLNGEPVSLGEPQPEATSEPVPRAKSVVNLGTLEPGPYELTVSAVSPSGARRSAAVGRFHLPGPARQVVVTLVHGSVPLGAESALEIEVFDHWRQHVADGTEVRIAVPDGWKVDGKVPAPPAAIEATHDGLVKVSLSPGNGAVPGLVLVTADRVTESVPVSVQQAH